jgi:hypothetical protein
MLYVRRLDTAHGTRVRHTRVARLEAGRVSRVQEEIPRGNEVVPSVLHLQV